MEKLKKYIDSVVTGLDAIQKVPIVDYKTKLRCLRIGDISQNKSFDNWGYTNASFLDVKQFLIRNNDNFIARTGSTIGCSWFADKNFDSVFNNGIIRLRTNNLMLPKYLSYLMQTASFRKYVYNVGMGSATQPNIKINDMLDYEINVPSINIQHHIVNTILYFISFSKISLTFSSSSLPSFINSNNSAEAFLSSSWISLGDNLLDSSAPTYLPGFKE
ncbi:restriction endonuclease subunit S [Metamycoplasma hyosynoviae]|uniref:restriction endonuclease subunit S n=1 Tax=Metamycoplasma hyosynoviae TaxID=29559 RepID=UPI0023593BDC|nr:restriction endonuclease subunit S [Metamycoplasma hyosynoviae]MDC8912541.1 restriction endonuclease subunit S [Metamycoplasma hyosynoviae]MDD1361911.1 restriction endonuclease subunit S [Metamycoplasma hyosynoviae]